MVTKIKRVDANFEQFAKNVQREMQKKYPNKNITFVTATRSIANGKIIVLPKDKKRRRNRDPIDDIFSFTPI